MLEIINKILFWNGIFWLIFYAHIVFLHGGIPNIRTASATRKKIIAFLKEDFETRRLNAYTIVDLGSGNGRFTREIAKAMPQAKIIGIEIAKHAVLWSNWMKRRQNLNNLEYRRMNFLMHNFSEADAIVMYLHPTLSITLGKKLHAETRPDTFITANAYRLGDGWEPIEIINVKTLYPNQRELYIYRK